MIRTSQLGALIFRDHGKRTENTEMAFGNGKCNFKRKITENHFSAGKNNKIHKIYKISQTKWIYFHATLPRIRVYIYNTHLYVNGISNILYVQSLWENGISIFPPYWNGIEDFQKRKRQFFETENLCPYICVTSWNQKGWKPGFYELTQICRRVSVRGVGDELFSTECKKLIDWFG